MTISNSAGKSEKITVPAGEVMPIFPQKLGFPDQSLDHSGIENKAYRLTSTRPIVAYQFNPLDNENVFSNDASLLLPSHTFDTEYFALGWRSHAEPLTPPYRGYVTVVASAPGATQVTVTPSGNVMAGPSFDAIAGGASRTIGLSQFQTLSLHAMLGTDITGTKIVADKPVGVFVGHESAFIYQNELTCCSDHLEDQLFPASTWGKKYVIARSKKRYNEPDMVRVIAQKPSTQVSVSSSTSTCGRLDAGKACTFFIDGDVEIDADKPILVAHYLLSIASNGDPAIDYAVPVEQYRTSYTFLVPDKYDDNYVSLVAPAGGEVDLDGKDLTSELDAIGSSGQWVGGRFEVDSNKPHRLSCPDTCSVEVYGYSLMVSYLYAGGLDLEQIVPK
ncbi:MAG: IgGFc-binding protein [Pseudomonadota bacterium]